MLKSCVICGHDFLTEDRGLRALTCSRRCSRVRKAETTRQRYEADIELSREKSRERSRLKWRQYGKNKKVRDRLKTMLKRIGELRQLAPDEALDNDLKACVQILERHLQ